MNVFCCVISKKKAYKYRMLVYVIHMFDYIGSVLKVLKGMTLCRTNLLIEPKTRFNPACMGSCGSFVNDQHLS